VGIHATMHGDRFEALEPLRQGVRDHFGGLAAAVAVDLGRSRWPKNNAS